MKMNTLLGVVDHLHAVAVKQLSDYANLFKKNQGMFQGRLNTYTPREGYPDDPSKKANVQVTATVAEEFEYMLNDSDPQKGALSRYLKNLFSVESTNSIGAARVPLVVEGVHFGDLTAIELMRLKNVLTSANLDEMLKVIPVRSDATRWMPTTNPNYVGREIFETELQNGVARTSETEQVVLKDPNIDPANVPANYRAAIVPIKRTYEIADYTLQNFSGEWTQTQKALLLGRKSILLNAVNAALKDVNDVEQAAPNLDVDKLLGYIFKGDK